MKKILLSATFLFFFSAQAQTKYFDIPGVVEIPGKKINGKIRRPHRLLPPRTQVHLPCPMELS